MAEARILRKVHPTARIQAIEQAYEKLGLNPLGFDDYQVNDAYEKLKDAIGAFSATVTLETRYDGNNYARLCVPLSTREANEDGYYAALDDLNKASRGVVAAYTDFLVTCRMKGMDVYDREPSA